MSLFLVVRYMGSSVYFHPFCHSLVLGGVGVVASSYEMEHEEWQMLDSWECILREDARL